MATIKDRKVNVAEYGKLFTDQVDDADGLYAESLQRLKRIRGARKNHQKRELKRLAKNLGDTSPRVTRNADRIVREMEMENYIAVAIDRTSQDTDSIKDTFILRGKLRADNIKGLARYRVQLQDARNNVIGAPSKTDSNGNYSIVLDIEESEQHEKLILAVLDMEGTEIHKERMPVLLKTGAVDRRDIVIANIDEVDRSRDSVLKNVLKSRVTLSPHTKKVVSKKTTTKKATTKKATTKKATSKKATSKKATSKKATTKKATTKKATAKKITSKKITAKKIRAKKTVAKKATTKKAASKKVVSKVGRSKTIRKKTT